MLQARANIAVELSRLLGRDRSIAGQKLGIPMAIACWVSNLFASTNQLWGALVLMAMPVTTISLGVYLIFISTDSITKTQVFLAAKVTTAGGDVLEAISLVILDFIVRNRSIAAIVSLALATALRCCGKVFANSGEWSNGGVLLEILGEGGLCLLRWRLLLTEGRWKVSHDWGMVRRDQSVTVAEQVSRDSIPRCVRLLIRPGLLNAGPTLDGYVGN